MVGLPGTRFIEKLIVDSPAGAAIMFSSDVHSGLPSGWGVDGYSFQYPESTVSVQSCLNSLLPVEGYRSWAVISYRDGIWGDVQL